MAKHFDYFFAFKVFLCVLGPVFGVETGQMAVLLAFVSGKPMFPLPRLFQRFHKPMQRWEHRIREKEKRKGRFGLPAEENRLRFQISKLTEIFSDVSEIISELSENPFYSAFSFSRQAFPETPSVGIPYYI